MSLRPTIIESSIVRLSNLTERVFLVSSANCLFATWVAGPDAAGFALHGGCLKVSTIVQLATCSVQDSYRSTRIRGVAAVGDPILTMKASRDDSSLGEEVEDVTHS